MNWFSPRSMVPRNGQNGDIPTAREAYGAFFRIALPAVTESISIALIGLVSMVMVGGLGPAALTAVGLSGEPRMIFFAPFIALNVGVMAIIARRKGAGDQKAARLCLRQALMVAVVLGLLMTLLSLALSRPIMQLAGAQADTLSYAVTYFRIVSLALVFNVVTGLINVCQKGVGNARVPLVVNVSAHLVNVALHLVLIEGRLGFPAMGIAGAGVAVLVSGVFSAGLAVFFVSHRGAYLYLSLRAKGLWRLHRETLQSIARIGKGAAFEQLFLRVGFFAFTRVVASLGTAEFAAHQITVQAMALSFTLAEGLGAAAAALMGQQLGAKRPDLAAMYGKMGVRIGLLASALLCVLTLVGRFAFPALFTEEAEIIHMAAALMVLLMWLQPIQTIQFVLAGALRGAGDIRFVAFTMLLAIGMARPLISFSFVFLLDFGLMGAWYAVFFDQTLRLVLLYTRFARGKWTKVRV